MDADRGIHLSKRPDDPIKVEHPGSQRHFAEEKTLRCGLQGHVLEVHAHHMRSQCPDRFPRVFEQGEIVARIHEHPDPFAGEFLHQAGEFGGGVVLVILDRDLETVFPGDRFDPGKGLA